jgi:hypothetical protein
VTSSDLGPADVLTPIQQIRLELRARPGRYLTTLTLCDLTGLTVAQVNHALYRLTKDHKILRAWPGRREGQAYAWNFRGVN